MNRHILLGAVFALLVAACQTAPGQTGAAPSVAANRGVCNAAVCQIHVNVTGSPPRISVDVDELVVARGNQGPGGSGVAIQWRLANNDYEFRGDSIQYYDSGYGSQFDQLRPEGNGSQFHCRNKNSAVGRWGYLIKLYNKRTGASVSLDPAIFNDGP
jgi:hypothetical protein